MMTWKHPNGWTARPVGLDMYEAYCFDINAVKEKNLGIGITLSKQELIDFGFEEGEDNDEFLGQKDGLIK